MPISDLELTHEPVPDKAILLCIPGTYCSPVVFETLDQSSLPDLQLVPISWMTSSGPWDIPTLGQRVAALIGKLSATGPVLLAGHSTGGAIAIAAALAAPEKLRGLLLIDTGANAQGHGDMAQLLKMIEAGPDQAFLNILLKRSFFHQPDPALLEQLSAYANKVPRQAALEALQSQSVVDMAPELARLTMPTIILHGKHDQARPLAHAQLLVEHIPHAELQISDAGHTPLVEQPADYQQAVRQLFERAGL